MILRKVEEALARPTSGIVLPPEEYDRRHLQLIGDKLHQKTVALEDSNRRLTQFVADLRVEVENRRRAEAEAAERREWLEVVLSSIGDAVIATDASGRVTFLNPVAERMTGWRHEDAVGRPLPQVFRIVNEEHGGPVENPVDKVLREGTVVGLANHTVLIARDGTRRPIDDCAAPIRGDDDRILGVVLVFHDVSASRELEHQLRDRAERLAEADRRKDEFLAMLAHELRNPLAPIRNSLYVLEVSPHDAQVVEEMRGIMRRQIEHLVRLVDDLLDVSRITRGMVALRPEPVDVAEVVRQSLVDHARRAEASGLSLAAELPDGAVWLEADPTRLKQVIDNLLGNALKFTDRGGTVTVSAAEDAAGRPARRPRHGDRHRARDPAADLRAVRAGGSVARPQPGRPGPRPGAGPRPDRAARRLGRGAERGPGHGSEFAPLRLRAARAGAAPTHAGPEPTAAGGRRRVLVVEDHRDSAETLRRILSFHGYDVAVAHDGPGGLAEVKRFRPDAVVCDIGLPGMDGFAVASALRADPSTAGIRLIALSGYGRDEDIRRAREAGFDGHIVKPASPAELIERIEGK